MVAPRFGKIGATETPLERHDRLAGHKPPAQTNVKSKPRRTVDLGTASAALAEELTKAVSYEVRAGLGVSFDPALLDDSRKKLTVALVMYGEAVAERSKEG